MNKLERRMSVSLQERFYLFGIPDNLYLIDIDDFRNFRLRAGLPQTFKIIHIKRQHLIITGSPLHGHQQITVLKWHYFLNFLGL